MTKISYSMECEHIWYENDCVILAVINLCSNIGNQAESFGEPRMGKSHGIDRYGLNSLI